MTQTTSLIAQLHALGIQPRKGLSQNFLVDRTHQARIVGAAGLTKQDVVLEVGPGPGVLTELLAEYAGAVVAVELDTQLVAFLRQKFCEASHVTIVEGDILRVDVGPLVTTAAQRLAGLPPASPEAGAQAGAGVRFKVVANLPYNITGAAIQYLLSARPMPALLVLTVQREVAQRMVARPPDMSLLALGVQFYTDAEIVGHIPGGAFYPAPKVESAVVRLRERRRTLPPGVTPELLFRVARAGFSQKRKQLRNSLSAGLGLSRDLAEALLSRAGIAPSQRPEELDVDQWATLAQEVCAHRAAGPGQG